MSCLNEHELEVVSKMSKYGGSFVKALAECFHHADRVNKEILIKSFPIFWAAYQPNKRDDNLAEQADQDLKEDQFTGDASLI